ncbi:MAG: efflux RND transporter periplasmic adaptor subunit [Bacteroidetes bacterium]|nr:efflux RND transporter periplasmic adaptor subunit [Bacteroidota bacterium]
MKKQFTLLLLMSLIMSSCWRKEKTVTYIRPVKLATVESLSTYKKDFIGTVTSGTSAELSFQVGGIIKKTHVSEGTRVKKGDLIAEIDPQDFILNMNSNKSSYDVARSTLERNKRLVDKNAISQQDYEISIANFETAKSAYEYSVNQLEYTKLYSPFDGSVERKDVNNYQKVSAGTVIIRLITPNSLEIDFTIPESEANITGLNHAFFVEFDNIKGKLFKTEVKDIVDASVNGMGIPVTLKITDPEFDALKYKVKAGFACNVKVELSKLGNCNNNLLTIPITAIFSKPTNNKDKFVWIYNRKKGCVNKRKVTTSYLMDEDATIVTSGLKANEEIVIAGIYQLSENQKVNVLK